MDFLDPFLTFAANHPDFNRADSRRATEQLFLRQQLIEDFIEGNETAEAVLDCIEEHGIDASEYAQGVENTVDAIVSDGKIYLTNEAGLLLPGRLCQDGI